MIHAEKRLEGAALHILLNRPKANILDASMIAAIQEALDTHVSERTALVVFEGAGDHFCFGASVAEHRAEQAPDMLRAFHGLFARLADLAIPTCAVVRGQCLGGGLELASWCTWIVATPDARLGQPEIKLGVFPPMASLLLPWRVGGPRAMDLCVSGRSIGAQEALKMGLLSAVTDDPTPWWEELVSNHLAKTSASSLRFAERAARSGLLRDMEQLLPGLEKLYLEELMTTPDANEGIASFLERRPPSFSHESPLQKP